MVLIRSGKLASTKGNRNSPGTWFFSRMRSKGSRFTLGVWGWRCVRLTLSNRPQPFAGHLWRCQASRSMVSHGRRGTLWHVDLFGNMSKLDLRVAGALLLRRFLDMRCSFRGRRSTSDVSCCVLCESQWQGCAKW